MRFRAITAALAALVVACGSPPVTRVLAERVTAAPIASPTAQAVPPAPTAPPPAPRRLPRPTRAPRAPRAAVAAPAGDGSWTCAASFYDMAGGAHGMETAYPPDQVADAAGWPRVPMGGVLRLTWDGRSVTVTVVDRGPFSSGRCIDLSREAFAALGSLGAGVLYGVRVQRVG